MVCEQGDDRGGNREKNGDRRHCRRSAVHISCCRVGQSSCNSNNNNNIILYEFLSLLHIAVAFVQQYRTRPLQHIIIQYYIILYYVYIHHTGIYAAAAAMKILGYYTLYAGRSEFHGRVSSPHTS